MATKKIKRPRVKLKQRIKLMRNRYRRTKSRFRQSFRSMRRPSFSRMRARFRSRPRRYSGGNGGFRAPFMGRKSSSNILLIAVIGGIAFLFKDFIRPMIEKLTHKS